MRKYFYGGGQSWGFIGSQLRPNPFHPEELLKLIYELYEIWRISRQKKNKIEKSKKKIERQNVFKIKLKWFFSKRKK